MSSDVSKCDQVVFECMQKVAEVIISSRVSLHQKQRRDREINSKFSLHVEELAFVRHSMEAWKDDLHMPLGIDVFWQEHSEQSERLGLGDAPPSVELLERWDIVYEAQDGVETKSAQLRHLYKRAIILLRTLYAFVRMVPAYQVHERIQKAYDSRDRALVDTRDDMGFCLYPILDLSRGGLGLEFSGAGSGEKDETRVNTHVGQGGQTASTDSYSFKPLEAPHGKIKIKVTYRRGVDSKAYQHGQTVKKQTSSLAPNMTTSIIQDYVPHDYEHTGGLHNEHEGESPAPSPAPAAPTVTAVAAVSGGETTHEQWPRLATMQEDGAMAAGSVTDGCSSSRVAGMARLARQQFSSYATGGLEVVRPSDLGAAIDAHSPIDSQQQQQQQQQQQHRGDDDGTVDEANLGQGPDVLHWPSPEQGHGYAHNKRVNKLLGQGPAPFLTPGPHRHKLVPGGRQGPDVNMEPLDLGPKADVDARDPCVQAAAGLQPSEHGGCITHNNVEAFARSVGRRNSDRHCSAEYVAHCSPDKFRSLEPHGSLEGHVDRKEEALPEPHLPGLHVQDKHLRDGILRQRGLMARALGEEEEEGADSTARRFYRRNSICEAPSATPVPREQSLMSVHGNRSTAGHGPDTYAQRPPALTPPFSYCEEFSSARPAGVEADGSPFRLGQPLVSFSPPFEAPCVDPRGHGGALGEGISGVGTGESPSLDPDAKLHHGSEVTCTVPRASLGLLGTVSGSPALLETLPESPFSWKGRRPENTQPPMVVDKATPACRPASQSSPITPGRLAHAVPNKAAGTDTSEGLPFAVEMLDERIETFAQDPSVFGVDDGMGVAASLPPTSLFALCSAASSKSDLLMQNSQPMASIEQPAQALGFSPERGDADADAADWEGVSRATATSYANAGDLYGEEEVGKTVRSLEEELDGFRQFHLELERQRS